MQRLCATREQQPGGRLMGGAAARRRGRLLAVVGLALAVVMVAVAPAVADEFDPVTLKVGEPIENQEYPEILGGDVTSLVPSVLPIEAQPEPETCPSRPTCALVPIIVERPDDIVEGELLAMTIEVAWDNLAAGSPMSVPEFDAYLYDDGQIAESEGASGYTQVGIDGKLDNPERIVIDATLERYNLVVSNFGGPPSTWRLSARLVRESGEGAEPQAATGSREAGPTAVDVPEPVVAAPRGAGTATVVTVSTPTVSDGSGAPGASAEARSPAVAAPSDAQPPAALAGLDEVAVSDPTALPQAAGLDPAVPASAEARGGDAATIVLLALGPLLVLALWRLQGSRPVDAGLVLRRSDLTGSA